MDTKDINILVVEDEADLREAMMEALTEEGYVVSGAENGQLGLDAALTMHPDLILLDLMMPVLDGQEMFRQLRLDPWGKAAKVIILTAMDDVNNIALAHEAKPLDYFIKAHHSLSDLVKQVKLLMLTADWQRSVTYLIIKTGHPRWTRVIGSIEMPEESENKEAGHDPLVWTVRIVVGIITAALNIYLACKLPGQLGWSILSSVLIALVVAPGLILLAFGLRCTIALQGEKAEE